MTPWQKQALIALIGLLTSGGFVGLYNHYQREIGRRDMVLAQSRADLKAAKHRLDSLEAVYRVDTVRLWRTVRALDTLTVTVDRWKHDTLTVVQYVAKADTAIRACTLALGTCEQRVGAERTARLTAEQQVKLLQSQMPGTLTPWRHRVEGAVLGIAAYVLVGVLR